MATREIASSHSEAVKARAALDPNDQLLERLLPGWAAYGRDPDDRIDASALDAIERATVTVVRASAGGG